MKCKLFLLAVALSALVCVQASANINLEPWKTANPTWEDQLLATWTTFPGVADVAPDTIELQRWPLPELRSPSASFYVEADPPLYPTTSGPYTVPEGDGAIFASPVMRIELAIPNIEKPLPWQKIVQVEVVYSTNCVDPLDGYMKSALTAGGFVYDDPDVVLDDLTTPGKIDLTLTWELPDQRFDWESVSIWLHDSGVTVYSIDVGTVCVPVPGAVLLGFLGLSAAGLKLRKRA